MTCCQDIIKLAFLVSMALLIYFSVYVQETGLQKEDDCKRDKAILYRPALVLKQTASSTSYQVFSEPNFNCTLPYQDHPLYALIHLYVDAASTKCAYESEDTDGCDSWHVGMIVLVFFLWFLWFSCILYRWCTDPCERRPYAGRIKLRVQSQKPVDLESIHESPTEKDLSIATE
jgi:hypothetical protein